MAGGIVLSVYHSAISRIARGAATPGDARASNAQDYSHVENDVDALQVATARRLRADSLRPYGYAFR